MSITTLTADRYLSYHWDFGNGTSANTYQAPTVNYQSLGQYDVQLTVTSQTPFVVIDTISVLRTNDDWDDKTLFGIYCDQNPHLPDFYIKIFDQTGKQLYETAAVTNRNVPVNFIIGGITNENNFKVEVWERDVFPCVFDDKLGAVTIAGGTTGGVFKNEGKQLEVKVSTKTTTSATFKVPVFVVSDLAISKDSNSCIDDYHSEVVLMASLGYATYRWSNGATTQAINVGPGTYSVTATSANGCVATASILVEKFAADIAGNLQACDSQGTALTALPSGCTYQWSNGATTRAINVGPGTYTVTATAANGCVATASKVVEGFAADITGNLQACGSQGTALTAQPSGCTYRWSNGATTQAINVGPGTYTVTATSANGCVATASKVVERFAADITGNLQACGSQGTALTAQPSGCTYRWSNGATTQAINVGPGTYTVTATSASGCSSSKSATVVLSAGEVSLSSSSPYACPGEYVEIKTSQSYASYLWSNGATTRAIQVGVGTYRVTTTDGQSCQGFGSITIGEMPDLPAPPVVSCANGLLSSSYDSFNQWLDANFNPIDGATGKTFAPLASGTYYVLYSGGNCHVTSEGVSYPCSTPLLYHLAVSASPAAGGNVFGQGNYPAGTTVDVSAVAAQGYVFVSWTESDTILGIQPAFSFALESDRSLVANFVKDTSRSEIFQVYPNPTGGNVTIEAAQPCRLRVYNTIGQLLREDVLVQGTNYLNFEVSGCFMLEFIQADAEIRMGIHRQIVSK